MLTKFILYYDNFSQQYELQPDDLKNWDEIKCCYKRSEYSGIVRSFTSKFEFCNEAYRIIMDLFDRKGFASRARLDMMVMNDRWEYDCEFTAELDFSTLTYTHTILSINAIDNGTAAVIKANKSTKFEFVVGEDIPTCGEYVFDRLQILETATYEITQGESQSDGSLKGTYTTDQNKRLYVGRTGYEMGVGKVLLLNEDQTNEAKGCMFKAMKSTSVNFEWHVNVWLEGGCGRLVLMKNDEELYELSHAVKAKQRFRPGISSWSSIEQVMNYIHSDPYLSHDWAVESWDGDWVVVNGIVWEVRQNNGNTWENTGKSLVEYCTITFSDSKTFNVSVDDEVWIKFDATKETNYQIASSLFEFSWKARGSAVRIDAIRPLDLLEAIIMKFQGAMPDVGISDYDTRLANTLILASESVRAIPGAKIYASFNDFCNWMETVFGYTYEIDEEAYGMLIFKHRKEIFKDNAPVVEIPSATNIKYSIEKSVLYATINVGYAKKDYEGVNGRDEFNFNNTYQTGYTVTEKKLELKSPFRADSYGLEFNVQKRGEDTTDDSSDKDVFFVLGRQSGLDYYTVRNKSVVGAISNTMINGEFSPMECAAKNREFISLMATEMELIFASSEGNSDITIAGVKMSDNLIYEDLEMLTPGELTFTCEDIDMPADFNSLIKVRTEDFIYRGYIKDISRRYANPEAIEMTIMIKDKTPC